VKIRFMRDQMRKVSIASVEVFLRRYASTIIAGRQMIDAED